MRIAVLCSKTSVIIKNNIALLLFIATHISNQISNPSNKRKKRKRKKRRAEQKRSFCESTSKRCLLHYSSSTALTKPLFKYVKNVK